MRTAEQGRLLIRAACKAIAERLGVNAPGLSAAERAQPWLHEIRTTFVTLTLDGSLRGCIGGLEARRPLLDDLEEHARAAAFDDPRFPPLTVSEFARLHIEVSILSPLEPLAARDEAGALAALRPGMDGVVLSDGSRRSTFLPQVWEELPDPVLFLSHLKEKAGLPRDYWSPQTRLQRYTVEKFSQTE